MSFDRGDHASAVITVEGLGKQYRLGATVGHTTLRETLVGWVRRPFAARGQPAPTFWALQDVSFTVAAGEVLGIIGANGAGKSTLLKVLSRITEPTTGRVTLYGRVGSLLEVGTGFHSELTGRENIYLSGAILGMRRREIERCFDAIVAFAEVERFLDTPVKRYSSGMYLRLAFAVAAHLEPEVLLVDEILAVGDAAFQRKCLGKMGDVARSGRTVLFVSHNMAAVEALCSRCLLLGEGRIRADGPPDQVIERYLAALQTARGGRRSLAEHAGRRRDSKPEMRELALLAETGAPTETVRMGGAVSVQVAFATSGDPVNPVLGLVVRSAQGMPLFGVNNRFIPGYEFPPVSSGRITCRLEALPLMPGTYFLDLYFGDPHADRDVILDAVSFEVVPADVFGSGRLPPPAAGPLFQRAHWELAAHD
jgi:lipopolysaccharide transport system ATP-binding protein